MELNTPSFIDLLPLALVSVAVVAGVLAFATSWRRRSLMSSTRASVVGSIIYRDTPTVRVVDAQRVDRLRKVVRLNPGQFVDLLEPRHDAAARFRITLHALNVDDPLAPAAHLLVNFGGISMSCGPAVIELRTNEFLLPRTSRDEHRSSIFHFHERGDALDFTRIKLRGIDVESGVAEIDVLHVEGSWPNG
jgi:hypothetical protein